MQRVVLPTKVPAKGRPYIIKFAGRHVSNTFGFHAAQSIAGLSPQVATMREPSPCKLAHVLTLLYLFAT